MIKYTHRHKEQKNRVRILCQDVQSGKPIVLAMEKLPGANIEHIVTYTKADFNSFFEEIKSWEDCKIDDPVYVRDGRRGGWLPRYFAGVDDHGRPQVWMRGATSFSTDGSCIPWQECIPADQFDKDNPPC